MGFNLKGLNPLHLLLGPLGQFTQGADTAHKNLVDDPKEEAEAELAKTQQDIKDLENQAKERTAQEEADQKAGAERGAARRRQRARMAMALGRRGTIITSPLGLPGYSSEPGKKLLGE